MHRHCCRPVSRFSPIVSPVCSSVGVFYQSYIYSQKCAWWWVNLSAETCRADLKRSIKGMYCILLVVYIFLHNIGLVCHNIVLKISQNPHKTGLAFWAADLLDQYLKLIICPSCEHSVKPQREGINWKGVLLILLLRRVRILYLLLKLRFLVVARIFLHFRGWFKSPPLKIKNLFISNNCT
jgi:hypothetical protein